MATAKEAKRPSSVEIIGVPLDLGANIRGANMGPAAIRIAGLQKKLEEIGCEYHDIGDLPVPVRETLTPEQKEDKHLKIIAELCTRLAECTQRSLEKGRLPITIGGDHSLAIGSISGIANYHQKKEESLGVIWFDAHADINTPQSSPSGNIHGMPLATLLGNGHPDLTAIGNSGPKVNPAHCVLVGIRSIDGAERNICKESGVRYYTMREIDERGMHTVMQEAIAIASKATGGIHVSFDLDGVDPGAAPGVSTPVTGGLSYREAHLALEMIADTRSLRGVDMVELNPSTDINHKTANLAVELIQSALGKAII